MRREAGETSVLSRISYVRWYGRPIMRFAEKTPYLPHDMVLKNCQYTRFLLCWSSWRIEGALNGGNTHVFGVTCTTFSVSDGSLRHTQASASTNERIFRLYDLKTLYFRRELGTWKIGMRLENILDSLAVYDSLERSWPVQR